MVLRHTALRIRRATAVLLATAVSATLLAACGSTDGASSADAAPGSGFPVTIRHAIGSTTIKSRPQRVIALDTGELDDVTALGITPVGAVAPHMKTEGGFPTYLKNEVKGTKDVGPMMEPNLELIASLHPDLIISSKVRHEKIYNELDAIAPTVFAETTGEPWKANFRLYAKALGREHQADQLVAGYEKRAHELGAEIRKKYGGTMPTASVVRFNNGPTRLYQKASFSGTVLSDIGLRRPPSQNVDDSMTNVSPEEIDKADADLVFVTVADVKDASEQQQEESNPVWRGMSAVKNHKVFDVPDETWMSGIGVQAADGMLADVARAADVPLPH
ncbi:iron-siderophore ABC transporter substrate-binding protein [Streptomyces sp. RB6PN25]|uniref:Iron-siderophore ABC transporter substrate-binding protein n=1 Tax=Streptomyces humicola TaxID=2953240 RepID=A0ABT1PXE0_9ACTN|nr:iron-siderophore ABC transporter substrate-binding protein [Streptomyces humicola]MCQ4082337.1 iron-siderophore ABC transporter substrate-binding protein [Streptomyces humicola]